MDKEALMSWMSEDPLTSSWWPWIIALIVGVLTCIKTYMGGLECPSKDRVDGKVAVVTGANSGVGFEIALELAMRGAHIILACRNIQAGNAAAEIIRSKVSNARLTVGEIDLCSFISVKRFVQTLNCPTVDILINNAGVVFHPEAKTKDGFEIHLQTNYLGHFLLTHLLLPRLMEQGGRVICTSAVAHTAGDISINNLNLNGCFSSREAFMQSKLAVVMMTREMARRFGGSSVTFNAFHPGMIRGTNHMRHSPFNKSFIFKAPMMPWIWLLTKNATQAAQTGIYLAVSSEVDGVSGKYFSDCELKASSEKSMDDIMTKKLYDKTCNLLELQGLPDPEQ